jgi:hypothetical protein
MASSSVSQDGSMEDDDNRIEWVERDFYKVPVNSRRIVYICPAPPHFLYTKDRQGSCLLHNSKLSSPFQTNPSLHRPRNRQMHCQTRPRRRTTLTQHTRKLQKMQLGRTNFGWNWITLCQMGYPRGSRLELKKTHDLHKPDTVGRGCPQETEIQRYPLPWNHPNNHRIFHNRLRPEVRRISI